MYKPKTLTCPALALALSASLLCGAPARAETTLVLNAFLPAQDTLNVKVIKPWAEDVAKQTHGRVKIRILPTSIAAPDQLWNSVKNSVVDGAYIFNGTVQKKLKLMQMAHLPFVSSSAEGNSVGLWRTYENYFAPAGEYRDVHLLGLMVLPSGIMYSMKQPIQSVQDLHGVKVWALPGVPSKTMALAGAGVISTPAAKMSEIVAGGTVDAFAGIPDMHARTFKVLRYARSATVLPGGLSAPSFSLILNKRVWQALSQEDRDIITKLSGEALARRMRAIDGVEAAAHEEALKGGLKYKDASPQFVAEMKSIAAPLEKSWLASAGKLNVDGTAALAYYRSESRRVQLGSEQ
jgi:TRAP-type C4-dicarboxylate transport system substrate-binding protein